MRKLILTYFWTVLIVILLLSFHTEAQHKIDGSLGVDLHAISSSSESNEDSYPKVDGNRFLSNHYVSFKNRGNIKNENFANYSLFSSFKGFFTSTNTGNAKLSSYNSPNLNNLGGNVTFFPKRSYPINFYYLKLKDVTLRYNETNRSKTELLTPSLATLQKNRINDEKYGTAFSSTLFKGASMSASYDKSSLQNSYDYDFGENRNIIITSLELPGDIFSNTVQVIFRNTIKDDSVRIISGIINEIIPPDFTTTIVFDTGFHLIDIIPLHKYKQSTISIDMKQGQLFSITIDTEDFPAQGDNINETTNSNLGFDYSSKKLELNTTYAYEDIFRKNVNLQELSEEIKNSLKYNLTRKFNLVFQTEKTKRENSRGEFEKQITNNFQNKSILNFVQRRGFIGSLSHEYNKDKTNNADGSEDIINSTKYISRLSLPSEILKHSISLNN